MSSERESLAIKFLDQLIKNVDIVADAEIDKIVKVPEKYLLNEIA
jgi:hypothetical protein